jgi:hypothetical protein
MTDTATLAVWDAIAAAITAGIDPPVRLIEDRFYRDGEVPAQTPVDAEDQILSYCLLGQDFEGEAGYINQVGQTSRYVIHCWANTPTNASRLYQWLKRTLHGRRLTLEGHTMAVGITMTKGGHTPDPDGRAYQVPADLDVETLAA